MKRLLLLSLLFAGFAFVNDAQAQSSKPKEDVVILKIISTDYYAEMLITDGKDYLESIELPMPDPKSPHESTADKVALMTAEKFNWLYGMGYRIVSDHTTGGLHAAVATYILEKK